MGEAELSGNLPLLLQTANHPIHPAHYQEGATQLVRATNPTTCLTPPASQHTSPPAIHLVTHLTFKEPNKCTPSSKSHSPHQQPHHPASRPTSPNASPSRCQARASNLTTHLTTHLTLRSYPHPRTKPPIQPSPQATKTRGVEGWEEESAPGQQRKGSLGALAQAKHSRHHQPTAKRPGDANRVAQCGNVPIHELHVS